jgi:uncharacterized membrane protein YkvA (DUF1232 family)
LSRWPWWLIVAGALLYLVVPWDLDFIPIAGRLDDLLVLYLALNYAWKRRKAASADSAAGSEGRREDGGKGEEEKDPYRVLEVERGASEEQIRKSYLNLLARYHPDRVQHLGEEFRLMAARKTVALNRAYAEIKDRESGQRI